MKLYSGAVDVGDGACGHCFWEQWPMNVEAVLWKWGKSLIYMYCKEEAHLIVCCGGVSAAGEGQESCVTSHGLVGQWAPVETLLSGEKNCLAPGQGHCWWSRGRWHLTCPNFLRLPLDAHFSSHYYVCSANTALTEVRVVSPQLVLLMWAREIRLTLEDIMSGT